MEPLTRIELVTPSLPWRCSTTELQRQDLCYFSKFNPLPHLLYGLLDLSKRFLYIGGFELGTRSSFMPAAAQPRCHNRNVRLAALRSKRRRIVILSLRDIPIDDKTPAASINI